jgi:hypothetical protein
MTNIDSCDGLYPSVNRRVNREGRNQLWWLEGLLRWSYVLHPRNPYLSVLLASSPKGKKGRSISIKDNASLADLAENIKNSVMIVIAE